MDLLVDGRDVNVASEASENQPEKAVFYRMILLYLRIREVHRLDNNTTLLTGPQADKATPEDTLKLGSSESL